MRFFFIDAAAVYSISAALEPAAADRATEMPENFRSNSSLDPTKPQAAKPLNFLSRLLKEGHFVLCFAVFFKPAVSCLTKNSLEH